MTQQQPYPETTPQDLATALRNADRDPAALMREVIAERCGAPYTNPLPWTLLIPIEFTKPMPDGPGTLHYTDFFPRVPAHFRMHLPELLRADAVVDIAYSHEQGQFHILNVLSDGIMDDDLHNQLHQIPFPEDPISATIRDVARNTGTYARYWTVPFGNTIWQSISEETQRYESLLSLPPGAIDLMLQDHAHDTNQQWQDYINNIHETTGINFPSTPVPPHS